MLIVCCGMPRSGSTLQYNLVRVLLEDLGLGGGHGFLSLQAQSSRIDSLIHLAGEMSFNVIKVHALADEILGLPESQVVFLFSDRDLYEVVASAKRTFGHEVPGILESIDAAIAAHNSASAFPNFLRQQFTLLNSRPRDALAEIAALLKIDAPEAALTRAADANDRTSLGEQADKARRSPLGKLKRQALQLNRRMGFSKKLKSAGVSRDLLEPVRYWVLGVDRVSLLSPGHIGGHAATERTGLTDSERQLIHDRFHAWMSRR